MERGYPFAELTGRWRVEKHLVGSEFDIDIVATLKGNAFSRWLFAMVAKPQFKTVLIDLADAWAARMEREAGTAMTGKKSGRPSDGCKAIGGSRPNRG